MKRNLSKKEQVMISGIILIFLLMVMAYSFIFQPLIKTLIEDSKKENIMIEQMKNAENMVADKERLTKEVEEVKNKIKFYEQRLPSKVDIPQVLSELIDIGKKTNVIFDSIEPLNPEKITISEIEGKNYLEIPIEIRLKGGYHEFAKFVNEIENFRRFMKVDQIKISLNQASKTKHDISLVVSAFGVEEISKKGKGAN
ncbi:MAG: type 4a pilus biogenesis protein PilO [Candidatus Omnitrophica bacterium]|nr:type 4a pilus biogenesis protein PilO [Candidatus Omnitrophota bacterium]